MTGDSEFHNLLDRPRDAPTRTAVGVGVLTAVIVVLLAGSADRVDVLFGLSYDLQIWIYRVLFFIGPIIAAAIAHRVCSDLRRGEAVQADAHYAELEARAVAAAVSSQPQNPDQSEMERAEERA